jgi:TonB family protein
MSIRKVLLTLVVIVAFLPLLEAQYVRIGNAGVISASTMTPPTILKSTLALYTEEARTRGIEGTVTIEVEIRDTGQINRARVLKGLGFGLDEVALESIHEWQLSAATRDGVPVSVIAQIDVQFSLRSANALRITAGMIPPIVQHSVQPHYTNEALRAGYQGTVVLQAVIRSDGTVDVIRVVRGLPLGLTDNAIQALKQWQFKPGQKDGQNVDISLNVEINFNLPPKRLPERF